MDYSVVFTPDGSVLLALQANKMPPDLEVACLHLGHSTATLKLGHAVDVPLVGLAPDERSKLESVSKITVLESDGVVPVRLFEIPVVP